MASIRVNWDWDDTTLGEMDAAERGSGRDFQEMLKGSRMTRLMLAVFLREWRDSDPKPSPLELWQRVGNLRLSDGRSSTLPLSPDGASQTLPA